MVNVVRRKMYVKMSLKVAKVAELLKSDKIADDV